MYNKQTWLDEIPDMTKPIYDASGKQKTDPQTGRPLFELVQVGTRITSNRLNTMEGGIEAAHTLVEQLAKELGGNFVASINGTMGLQCSAQGLKASWTSGIAYVGGRRYQVAAGEMSLNPTQGQYLYVDTDGVVKKTTSQATAQKGLVLFYVATDTSGIISTTDHRVNVSLEEILKKLKDIDIEEAVTGGASGLMTGADAKFVRVDGETKTGAQEKADTVKEYVDSRLDTSEYSEVLLQSGLQVIQGKRNAPFNLNSIKGRTLVNLLGRVGGGEQLPSIDSSNAATLSVDTSTKDTGLSSYKVTATNDVANAEHYIDLAAVSIKAGSFYVAIGMVKPATNATTSILAYGTNAGGELDFVIPSDTMSVTNVFSPAVVLFKSTIAVKARIRLRVQNTAGEVIYTPNGEYANFDSIRLYEVTSAEYAELANMPLDQIAAKYPYVNSVQPVRNPYAIRYGENLLPPFYEWDYLPSTSSYTQLAEQYAAVISNSDAASGAALRYYAQAMLNEKYTLSIGRIEGDTAGGEIYAYACDANKTRISGKLTNTFTTPSNTKYLEVVVNSTIPGAAAAVGTFKFSNPVLTIGTAAKPFKPREDAMLALQTDMFADPLTGTNADEVFEKDGQYFKLAKWKLFELNGSISYVFLNSYTGFKRVTIPIGQLPTPISSIVRTSWLTKYDGRILDTIDTAVFADSYDYSATYGWIFSVSSADSGWGDAYNPTPDEIRAYFMGYKMYVAGNSADANYNGTGTKAWAARTGTNKTWVHYSEVVPTTITPEVGYTPYQLLYQLTTPTAEPITSEGQLTLMEGNNQVEVGTGLVLREPTRAVMTVVGTTEYYHFNNTYPNINNSFKYRVEKIFNIYANGKRAAGVVLKNEEAAYGKQDAHIEGKDFIKDGVYTATYLMLDTSPAASFVGSVPGNEKSLLTNLVQDVQQANARISVMESKKAEKGVPAWITPTLLNGWTLSSGGAFPAQYYKDSLGFVHVNGVITGGVSNTIVFILPTGYRPKTTNRIPSIVMSGTSVFVAYLDVNASGNVIANFPTQSTHLTINMSFLAEQ